MRHPHHILGRHVVDLPENIFQEVLFYRAVFHRDSITTHRFPILERKSDPPDQVLLDRSQGRRIQRCAANTLQPGRFFGNGTDSLQIGHPRREVHVSPQRIGRKRKRVFRAGSCPQRSLDVAQQIAAHQVVDDHRRKDIRGIVVEFRNVRDNDPAVMCRRIMDKVDRGRRQIVHRGHLVLRHLGPSPKAETTLDQFPGLRFGNVPHDQQHRIVRTPVGTVILLAIVDRNAIDRLGRSELSGRDLPSESQRPVHPVEYFARTGIGERIVVLHRLFFGKKLLQGERRTQDHIGEKIEVLRSVSGKSRHVKTAARHPVTAAHIGQRIGDLCLGTVLHPRQQHGGRQVGNPLFVFLEHPLVADPDVERYHRDRTVGINEYLQPIVQRKAHRSADLHIRRLSRLRQAVVHFRLVGIGRHQGIGKALRSQLRLGIAHRNPVERSQCRLDLRIPLPERIAFHLRNDVTGRRRIRRGKNNSLRGKRIGRIFFRITSPG